MSLTLRDQQGGDEEKNSIPGRYEATGAKGTEMEIEGMFEDYCSLVRI